MRFKAVILGDGGVGKSSLLYRFVKKQNLTNPESTCGTCFQSVQHGNIQLNIWDTAGQERYQSLIPFYTRGASVYLIVYDVTDQNTKKHAIEWCEKISKEYKQGSEMIEQPIICLIGNKSDLLETQEEAGYLVNAFDDSIEKVFEDIFVQLKNCKVEQNEEIVTIKDIPARSRCCFI